VTWCTDGLSVALQVWDIGGQSIGGRMLDKYIYGSHVSPFYFPLSIIITAAAATGFTFYLTSLYPEGYLQCFDVVGRASRQ